MKLRIRKNSLRIRLNRNEVPSSHKANCCRKALRFRAVPRFPTGYPQPPWTPTATFVDGTISLAVPQDNVCGWPESDEVGLLL